MAARKPVNPRVIEHDAQKSVSAGLAENGLVRKRIIYTTGYSGQDVQSLLPLLQTLDVYLFDIRYSPNSRVPHWRKEALEIGLGDLYRHIPEFGNRNYQAGSVKLNKPGEGGRLVDEIYRSGRGVLLMCVCKDHDLCHRYEVSQLLIRRGYDIVEVMDWKQYLEEVEAEQQQKSLF